MNRRQSLMTAACLASMISTLAVAAEGDGATQELQNVRISSQVRSAGWVRQSGEYVLRLSLDRTAPPQPDSRPVATAAGTGERQSFFLAGNTVADLRGLNPSFCGRTLTLVDGRRSRSNPTQLAQPLPPREPSGQPYQGAVRDPFVEVWLLKADGTLISPVSYRCSPGADASQTGRLSEISYGYSPEEGAQAVAAAIRVGNDLFLEKLQPSALEQ